MNLDEVEALIQTVTRQVIESLEASPAVPIPKTAGQGNCARSGGERGAPSAAPAAASSPDSSSFGGHLLTDRALRSIDMKGRREIRIRKDALVTPLARDRAAGMGISIIRCETPDPPIAARSGDAGARSKCAAFFSDSLRAAEEGLFRSAAEAAGYQVRICPSPGRGQERLETAIDCVRLVGSGECCRAVVLYEDVYRVLPQARRIPGVRPRVCWEVRTAIESRRNGDSNVLLLSARAFGLTPLKGILAAWFSE